MSGWIKTNERMSTPSIILRKNGGRGGWAKHPPRNQKIKGQQQASARVIK